MVTHFKIEAKMLFQLNRDLWFNLILMIFRANANARCPEAHLFKGHWTCLECLQGFMAVYGDGMIDGWMDGQRTDGLFVCPSI